MSTLTKSNSKLLKRASVRSRVIAPWSFAFALIAPAGAPAAAATLHTPAWANSDTLNGQFSSQSQKSGTSFNFTGIITSVTAEMLTNSVQVTFGLNAIDISFGLNVTNWLLSVEIWKSESDFLNRENGVTLSIPHSAMSYLDGTPVQTMTTGANTTFQTPIDYGLSSSGDTNHVLAMVLTGQNLAEFRDGLSVGDDIYIGVTNDGSVLTGTNYIILSDKIPSETITSFSEFPGLSFPTPGYGAALDIRAIPEASACSLFMAALLVAAGRRRRGEPQNALGS